MDEPPLLKFNYSSNIICLPNHTTQQQQQILLTRLNHLPNILHSMVFIHTALYSIEKYYTWKTLIYWMVWDGKKIFPCLLRQIIC